MAPVEALKPTQARQANAFEAVLGSREIRARRSLRGETEKIVDSESLSAELFGNRRSLDILDHLLRYIVPAMDTDAQTRELAEALLREEIQMRCVLEQQRSKVEA
jgi:hypothetical protein